MKNVENKETVKEPLWKKIVNIISYVFMGLLIVFDVVVLSAKVNMKSPDGGLNFFGTEIRLVQTGSMTGSDELYNANPDWEIKRIDVNDAVFVKLAPDVSSDAQVLEDYYGSFKLGDVMTFYFQMGTNIPVTHRIIDIQKTAYNYKFTLMGDNPTGDQTVSKYSPTQVVYSDSGLVIGKVTGVNKFMGNFLAAFVGNKVVLALVVIVPCGILMIYEIGKIVYYLIKNKQEAQREQDELKAKEKEEEHKKELESQENELAKLRAELEKLKGEKANDDA